MSGYDKRAKGAYLYYFRGEYPDKAVVKMHKQKIHKQRRTLIKRDIPNHYDRAEDIQEYIDEMEEGSHIDKYMDSDILETVDSLPKDVSLIR